FSLNILFRITKRKQEHRFKVDLDNLIKRFIDTGTGIFWQDDSQVTEIIARLKRNSLKPSITVKIAVFEGEQEN
ncbi:RusA family crossover junction endodeoxyribonuclease, partial [Patescibacteria group bacterium]|nr:RusA family crossover junction endodeoxyribonuclease [Patescibacteria group bacterium]